MRKAALLLIAGFVLVSMNIRAADPPKAVELPKAVAKGNLDFTGRIEAATLTIRPRVTGYLGKILVKEGATVKQGDLLAEIDARPYRARLDEARAKLTVAKASLKAASVNHDHMMDAVKKGIVNPSELAVSEAEKEKAAAMVEAEKATVSLVELDLSFTRLTSPMDGRIGRFAETAGNLVVADGPSIVSIVAVNPLFVTFDVDEKTILKLRRDDVDLAKVAANVALADEDDFPHKAVIDFIDPQFNPTTGTLRIRGVIDNPKGLMSPGMFVRVRLTMPAK